MPVTSYGGTGFVQTSWGVADNRGSSGMGMGINNLSYGFLINNNQITVTPGDTLELSYWNRGYGDPDTTDGAPAFYIDWYAKRLLSKR